MSSSITNKQDKTTHRSNSTSKCFSLSKKQKDVVWRLFLGCVLGFITVAIHHKHSKTSNSLSELNITKLINSKNSAKLNKTTNLVINATKPLHNAPTQTVNNVHSSLSPKTVSSLLSIIKSTSTTSAPSTTKIPNPKFLSECNFMYESKNVKMKVVHDPMTEEEKKLLPAECSDIKSLCPITKGEELVIATYKKNKYCMTRDADKFYSISVNKKKCTSEEIEPKEEGKHSTLRGTKAAKQALLTKIKEQLNNQCKKFKSSFYSTETKLCHFTCDYNPSNITHSYIKLNNALKTKCSNNTLMTGHDFCGISKYNLSGFFLNSNLHIMNKQGLHRSTIEITKNEEESTCSCKPNISENSRFGSYIDLCIDNTMKNQCKADAIPLS